MSEDARRPFPQFRYHPFPVYTKAIELQSIACPVYGHRSEYSYPVVVAVAQAGQDMHEQDVRVSGVCATAARRAATKRHLLTEGKGVPIGLVVSEANRTDMKKLAALLDARLVLAPDLPADAPDVVTGWNGGEPEMLHALPSQSQLFSPFPGRSPRQSNAARQP